MAQNKAAWLESKVTAFRIDIAPMPPPGPNQVVIKNHALAVNPADWKIQDTGLFIEKWPVILGVDDAGGVHEVGADVTRFKEGDRVAGYAYRSRNDHCHLMWQAERRSSPQHPLATSTCAGATDVYDYHSPSVVDDIVNAVHAAGRDSFSGVFDAISDLEQSFKHIKRAFETLGVRNYAYVSPGLDVTTLPAGVKAGSVFGSTTATQPVWADWATPALQQGLLKCLPDASFVGKGLEGCQKGCDELKTGVSAKKLVIEL